MKKFLLLTFISLAAVSAFGTAPRHRAHVPGFAKERKASPQRHQPTQSARPLPAVKATPYAVTPARYEEVAATASRIDVKRLLSYTTQFGPHAAKYVFEWDDYGFPSKAKTVEGSFAGEYTDYQYTWYDPGKKWSSKKQFFHSEDGNVYQEFEQIRTFHPNGSVASISEPGNRYREFDENGHLTLDKHIWGSWWGEDEYDFQANTYTYFALTDSWIEGYETPWEQRRVILDGDYGYYIEFWRDGHLSSKEGEWFDTDGNHTGHAYINYYPTDSIDIPSWGYGDRTENVTNPDGSLSEIYYDLQFEEGTAEWEKRYESVYSANYYDPYIYNPGEKRTATYYDCQYGSVQNDTLTWVNDRIAKRVSYYNGNYEGCDYYMVRSDNTLNWYDIYYDTTTGNYAVNDTMTIAGVYYDVYTYYNASGNIISQFREDDDSWEEWKGGDQWELCKDRTITVYEDSEDSYEMTFDSKGRITESIEYRYGVRRYRGVYTYNDKGVTYNSYSYRNGQTEYLNYVEVTETDGDITTETEIYYEADGSVADARKRVYDKASGIVSYYNKYGDGDWEMMSEYMEPIVETLADGTVITIERYRESDGTIIQTKYVRKDTEDYRLDERYSWDSEQSKWIGDWKQEEVFVKIPEFKAIYPQNPWEIQDEYFFNDNEAVSVAHDQWCYISYYWDRENSEWVKYSDRGIPNYTLIDNNTLRQTTDDAVYTTIVDDNRRVIRTEISFNDDYNDYYAQKNIWHEYRYDSDGDLIYDSELRTDNEIWTYEYTYGMINIFNGIDGIISEADGNADRTVYNLQGIPVLRDASDEAIRALPAGIYICAGKKFMVK